MEQDVLKEKMEIGDDTDVITACSVYRNDCPNILKSFCCQS